MRTRNPNYGRARDTALGRVGALRAGTPGITLSDGSTSVDQVTEIQFENVTVIDGTDGLAIVDAGSDVTFVGTVSADTSPFTVSSGTSYRAFPGAAWLTSPTAAEHTIGDTFLVVYRDGTDHLTAGNIVGKIATVTATSPWTYTLGSPFTIEDVANDLRLEDGISVLDIGGGDYRVVIVAREYNGSINLNSHILISDVASASVTSSSTWTRYAVTNSTGSTQSATSGRCLKLANGNYLIGAQWYSGATNISGVLISSDITDWSAPTAVTISSGYNECDIEEVSAGTLYAHLRETAQVNTYSSVSTDSGATWSAPTLLFAGGGYPAWRVLTSGIGLTVYRNMGANFHAAWRQTTTGAADTGWGDETILDSTGFDMEYATILQLDDNHALVIYAYQATAGAATDCDIYSQVFTDTSVFATGGTVRVSANDTTAGFLDGKLVAGTNITFTRGNAGADETLTIAAATFGGAASAVTVADAGGYYTGTNVETVLQELGAKSYVGEILISDTPSTPLVFADLIQNEAQTDLVYADP